MLKMLKLRYLKIFNIVIPLLHRSQECVDCLGHLKFLLLIFHCYLKTLFNCHVSFTLKNLSNL